MLETLPGRAARLRAAVSSLSSEVKTPLPGWWRAHAKGQARKHAGGPQGTQSTPQAHQKPHRNATWETQALLRRRTLVLPRPATRSQRQAERMQAVQCQAFASSRSCASTLCGTAPAYSRQATSQLRAQCLWAQSADLWPACPRECVCRSQDAHNVHGMETKEVAQVLECSSCSTKISTEKAHRRTMCHLVSAAGVAVARCSWTTRSACSLCTQQHRRCLDLALLIRLPLLCVFQPPQYQCSRPRLSVGPQPIFSGQTTEINRYQT